MLTLILIGGAAGTGKTSLAQALAIELGAAMIDLDEVTAPMVSDYLAAHPGMTEAQALLALRDERYALLADVAAQQDGLVIAVAPFSRELASAQDWAAWVAEAGRTPEQCQTVQVTLPADEHLRRLRERGAARDTERIAGANPPATVVSDTALSVLTVDASRPVRQLVEALLPALHGRSPDKRC